MRGIYNIVVFLVLISFVCSCSKNKIKIKKNTYSLDWNEMPYHNCTTKEIINQLGIPEKIDSFQFPNSNEIDPIYRPLTQFISPNSNKVYIKQLFWKQNSFQIYYWFVKSRDIWYSKYGIIFDPNHVEF